ncbi:hypothetical protein [Glycomyces sp. MUSA5-2]|uniref:hypothetical protein n=1 Tax=Glycomyces sp. MUSA5-2 TaxID=2053002 RepID=UPI00300ABFB2
MAPQHQNIQPSGPFTVLAQDQQGRPVKIIIPAGVARLANSVGPHTAQPTVVPSRTVIERLVLHGVIPNGEPFWFVYLNGKRRSPIHPWAQANQALCRATFYNDRVNCLKWDSDGQLYSATGLAQDLTSMATGRRPKSLDGPQFWVNRAGQDLVEIAKQHKIWP